MNLQRTYIKNKKVISNKNIDNNANIFKVTTYNILADCLIKRSDYPNNIKDEFLFKRVNVEDNVEKSNRHQLLVKEIDFISSNIYLWQEIDDFFLPLLKCELKKRGHEVVFHQKDHGQKNGIGISYDTKMFKMIDTYGFNLFDELMNSTTNQENIPDSLLESIQKYFVGLICTLQVIKNGKLLLVGATHTVYEAYSRPIMPALQACMVTQNINKIRKQIAAQYSVDENAISIIFGGDFNSEPDHALNKLMKQPKLDITEIEELKYLSYELIKKKPVKKVTTEISPLFTYFGDQLHNPLSLKSVYQDVLGNEPIITTADGNNYGTVDFIYASPNVQVHSVLNVDQNIKDVYKHGAPTESFASDHLPLTATLSL